MRFFSASGGAMLLLFSHIAAAHAATVFFYSDVEEYYGWAAGYNYSRSERDARNYCDKGGKDCKFVLECDGGWSAVAFADGFAKGVAFACGFSNAKGVRISALASCMAESKTLCWTSSTISGNGKERSEKENLKFDRIWYAQQFLYSRDFEPGPTDGEMGGKTRAALRAFQSKLGMEPTGEIDDATFDRLLDAVVGRTTVAAGMMRDLVDPKRDELGDVLYAHSSEPYAVKSFSEEIAKRPDDQRRLTLATLLTIWGTPCTLPAREAVPFPDDGTGGLWLVSCNEGDWTIIMSDGSHVIMSGLDTGGDEPKPEDPGPGPKPEDPGGRPEDPGGAAPPPPQQGQPGIRPQPTPGAGN